MWGFEIAVILAMIGVNSIFAGYEIALASISPERLHRLAEQNRRGAKVAVYMKQNMEASLAVVQLGITLVGAIAAAVGGAGAEEAISPALRSRFGLSEGLAEAAAIALVVIPLTAVTILVGELIPKVYALRNAERVCLVLSPYMRMFSYTVWPAVWLFETIVTSIMDWGERRKKSGSAAPAETAKLQDIRATAALARASRLLGRREEGIILGATEMGTRPIRDIMLPAEHMVTLDANASLADALIAAHLDMHTRFPVVEHPGDPQTILGYVNFKDIVAAMHLQPRAPSLRAIVRQIPSFQDDAPLTECLERLLREHTHIAVIRDARERVVGMITLEDIIEELVGDIQDEYDRLPAHIIPSGSSWVVGGGASLDRMKSVTGVDLRSDGADLTARTMGEWVAGQLGREPRGGDVVERGPLRVLVRKVRRNKVQEAQLAPDGGGTAAMDA